ncbi:beta-lactamase class A [Rhodopseudomonas thermotolerans]|uniref:Beta-lactamase n=3 Tax=Nitrobacteraceae TaxID=41294 RepID=A0A336JT72_9BRAD|nr:beta-lactamase class A [Rhodopseudomonas pentothenatexigens]REF91282.1 beta-lactamase class A [Rhodopseudomonas thermotolerans]SSW92758.1 beta-lactamase class A [Rhodopseudomonas pentothenatexigens]
MMIDRRRMIAAVAGALGAGLLGRPHSAHATDEQFAAKLADLEAGSGGRLGVGVLDTANGRMTGHRLDERFPMCSTFKALAAGLVLARVDRGQESLDRRVRYAASDLVTYSPATEKHVEDGMTIAELCEAAITLSDNTAGNLLLASFGGPVGLTAFARSLGDETTRLDRIETELNEALPGDPRDTTSPRAMAQDLRALTLGDALSATSRAQLIAWLKANTTGGTRLRAGVPAGWAVGDKTGTGDHATANDVAVLWPPQRPPLIVTVYLTGATVARDQQNKIIAAVGAEVVRAFGR